MSHWVVDAHAKLLGLDHASDGVRVGETCHGRQDVWLKSGHAASVWSAQRSIFYAVSDVHLAAGSVMALLMHQK